MLLPDVNVLVYAHRTESPEHSRYSEWLRDLALGPAPFGLSELGASGFVRIVTNPKIWEEPTITEDALEFIERLRRRSTRNFLRVFAGKRARGKLVADAYHAALAIEHGCELATVR